MIKYLGKKIMAIGLSLVLCCTGCNKEYLSSSSGGDFLLTSSVEKRMEKASKEPFGRYPETITYTLGKISNSDNAGMPQGDTFEDNAYTRYLKQQLNIQNENVFSGSGSDYNSMVVMAITSGEIPDIMVLEDYEYLKILVEKDMIEDLTPYYDQCASDRIKEIYSSYGSDYFNEVTFNGKMMAFPETLIDSGPNILWLRYDWLEELNLEEPKTIKDVENIAKQFKEHDMSKTGETIGLPMTTDISSDYIASMSILFASKGSYLRNWIKKDGSYQYGSIQPEAKEGLKELRRLYKEGTLDNQFLFRADNNNAMIVEVAGVIGPATPENLREYGTSKVPSAPKSPPKGIQAAIGKEIGPDLRDLLERIFVYSPKARITAAECMKHPFLEPVGQGKAVWENGKCFVAVT